MIGLYGFACIVSGRTLTSSPGPFLEDVGPRLTSYQHTISATFGFESATLIFPARDLEEAIRWADRLLCPVTVYNPDAGVAWDGYIRGVEIRAGGRTRAISLDTVANRVTVRYTLRGLGTPQVTSAASDTASQALYGVHDAVVSVGSTDSTSANALRAATLAARRLPRAEPQTSLQLGGAPDSTVEIVLQCEGWYGSLGWVVLERTDTSTEETTDQVGDLLGTSSPGIGATNFFISDSTAQIASSGVSSPRLIPADTTYRAAIEQRLSLGNSSSQRLAWGIYENRTFRVAQWAGADPDTIGYRVRFADATVETGDGAGVALWDVRPDAMVEDVDLLVVGPPSGAADTAARFYAERVTFTAARDGLSLTLEPEASSGLDARIARLS